MFLRRLVALRNPDEAICRDTEAIRFARLTFLAFAYDVVM